ncbi:hypothetical protein ACHAW6_012592 [Cyclotella cf. meneghiniana]
MYQSETATCIYIMRWSCPDIFNAVCRLARHMTAPREAHVLALMTLTSYMISTENRGLVLAPKEIWSHEYKFKIHSRSDSDYAMNPDDHRSISSGRVFKFHPNVCDSVGNGSQNCSWSNGCMLYMYHLLELLELNVEFSMVLKMDNAWAVDIVNSWSVGGRTRHMDVCNVFLHELKDQGLLVIKHIPGDTNDADIFTKNVT